MMGAMKAEFYKSQIKQLLAMVERNQGDEAVATASLPVADLLDPRRLHQEQAMFRRLPLIVGHSSEVSEAGDYIVRELDGRSWLIVRGQDGVARAFYNYCQHRGTKLVHQPAGSCQRRFVCPYHAWTYNNQGDLVGVPRADLFPGLDKAGKGLKPADLQEDYGFLWLTQDSGTSPVVADYLGGLEAELRMLGLQDYYLYFDKTRTLNANWKLPIFAFLEAYHIGALHKQSIGDFFIDNVAYSELFDPHIRSFVPRKNVLELADTDLSKENMSEYITPTNIIFPNVCMISHPTSMTVISLFPGVTPGTSSWRHMLLTPHQPKTESERAHYDKTIEVLDGVTYLKEDFWVSEQLQEGINAGAIDELTLGKNEQMLAVFNQLVEKYL
ncbi:MAG: aromatic ring-hydroxylating dioxygenase subunit alpha [Gammaproteobacteria bacterium]|nr:aromatic ring-hydroxylating dioxygenase subunit alpha [Gammaproteobacteria bacterium]